MVRLAIHSIISFVIAPYTPIFGLRFLGETGP